ncbi:TetR/AcrR family transcriptional regulator [Cellulomonas marina]|uniref:DNA-binding transcriptional regulator, AcrR family n=1 Tax=Cellulomonas marina TaxID=988821 RepID=A0A1I1AH41_9CELL|nr:TetR/AcrR family transcriptional regulator C-terminal domain-containing protein [Cellulomonas marina]GIG30175.1 putative transcriptional regulator, TetR family protein [Cellulomonas marina]SFB37324.1 DNA-binding transcriptional regulator, AcrR family [Cellulomonas marina]
MARTTPDGAPSRSRLPARTTDRAPLSRPVVVEAAIAYIDAQGLPGLTMRSLGQSLGVEAMSLYRYVNGREDLLEAVVDHLVGRLRLDPADELAPADGWQGYLQWLAHGVRALAHDHPNAFPLVATRHPAAPWLRPPLRSLDVVEDFLGALTSRGFSDEAAVAAYRAFSSFLLGHLLLEAASRGASTAPVEEPLDEGDADVPQDDTDLRDYPQTERLRELLSQNHDDEEFEVALESLLDRLDLLVSQ